MTGVNYVRWNDYFDCDSCICGFIVDSNDCEYKGETTETNRKRKLE